MSPPSHTAFSRLLVFSAVCHVEAWPQDDDCIARNCQDQALLGRPFNAPALRNSRFVAHGFAADDLTPHLPVAGGRIVLKALEAAVKECKAGPTGAGPGIAVCEERHGYGGALRKDGSGHSEGRRGARLSAGAAAAAGATAAWQLPASRFAVRDKIKCP